MMPKVSIFYVTFLRDLDFFRYSIKSVRKFCKDFHEIVVLVPTADVPAFNLFHSSSDPTPYRVIGYDETPGKGMLHHEIMVMRADEFCTGDYILHMDADVLFWEDTEPDDFFVNFRPVLYREKFENFKHYAARYSWKECVKNALGIDPEYETMVRHPAVHPKWIYHKTRKAVIEHTLKPFDEYVLSCRNEFPQTFAEYPTLGAFALANYPAAYHWVDHTVTNPDGSYGYKHGQDKVRAFWSHGGVAPVRHELELITS